MKKRVTMKNVRRRMKKMNIVGFSSMAKFTPAEHMSNLNEIQKIRKRRKRSPKK